MGKNSTGNFKAACSFFVFVMPSRTSPASPGNGLKLIVPPVEQKKYRYGLRLLLAIRAPAVKFIKTCWH